MVSFKQSYLHPPQVTVWCRFIKTGGRSAGENLSLQEGLHHYNGRKRKNQAGLQHLAPAKRKIQSHVSSLYRYISKYQASSKRKQNHALTEKDSDGHSGHSLGSIILPGTGSCWTWSGMAQTTSAEGHPVEEGTLIRYGFKHEPHTSVSPF